MDLRSYSRAIERDNHQGDYGLTQRGVPVLKGSQFLADVIGDQVCPQGVGLNEMFTKVAPSDNLFCGALLVRAGMAGMVDGGLRLEFVCDVDNCYTGNRSGLDGKWKANAVAVKICNPNVDGALVCAECLKGFFARGVLRLVEP